MMSLQNRLLDENVIKINRGLLEQACKKLPVTRKSLRQLVTGEIGTADAFERYLNSAIDLGLIQEISGALYNTKRGEILLALSTSDNPFQFNLAQSYFLLKILIEKDYDYLSSVFYCSKNNGENEYQNFFDMTKKIWQEKILNIPISNVEKYDSIRNAINTKRKNPKRYYREDIRATRLEWLLDLKIIEYWNIKKNKVIFRKNFESLLDSKNFSNAFVLLMKPLVKGSLTYWKELPPQRKNKIVKGILEESFSLFKTSETFQKISANQMLEYGVSILSESGIVCTSDELDNDVKNFTLSNSDRYRYVTILSDADRGYISIL